MGGQHAKPTCTLLSNHGHVLVGIAEDAHIRGRDIAAKAGVTERVGAHPRKPTR